MSTTPVHLVRIVLYAAFEATDSPADLGEVESLADGLAEQLRSSGALTVATDADDATREVDLDADDGLADALTQQWPELTDAERVMLDEAIDSHIYWQLSDEQYRDSGYVHDPGSDDEDDAKQITEFQALAQKIAGPEKGTQS